LDPNVSFPFSLLGDIELYTTFFALGAFILSHLASVIENDDKPTGPEIRKTRNALIFNSIAITINIVVFLLFFILIPITKASDDTMTFDYYLKFKSIAFLFSLAVTLAHFHISHFALLEGDYKWIVGILIFWSMINLSVEVSTGLFFAELNGTKNII
jgi:hypothetical protein